MPKCRNLTLEARKKLKSQSIQATIDGWMVPEWGKRGCLNPKILNSVQLKNDQRLYHVFRSKKLDLKAQRRWKAQKFRYPCYVVVKRLDQVLKRILGRKTGFRGC
jgi:hypothetical protein